MLPLLRTGGNAMERFQEDGHRQRSARCPLGARGCHARTAERAARLRNLKRRGLIACMGATNRLVAQGRVQAACPV